MIKSGLAIRGLGLVFMCATPVMAGCGLGETAATAAAGAASAEQAAAEAKKLEEDIQARIRQEMEAGQQRLREAEGQNR